MYLRNMASLVDHLNTCAIGEDQKIMIFLADRSQDCLVEITALMNERNIPFFGGIFPGLLHNGKYLREGMLVQVVRPVLQTIVRPFLFRVPKELQQLDGHTAIVLVDGLSSQFRDLIDTVESKLSGNITWLGGGAGHYDLTHRPCLFDNRGLYKDALMLCLLAGTSRVAVRHGWEQMDGPYRITGSDQNVLQALDGYRAMEVYRDTIETHRNIILSREDFFSFAKEHPFGLVAQDGSIVVRDPISCTDEGEIVCVADIPENRDVYILRGDRKTLLTASLAIAKDCAGQGSETHTPMLFSCISRAMFLEDDFQIEMENIQSRLKAPLYGTLSIGEIAPHTENGIVIHNKSTILGIVAV
jgi:hypothetical protein